jgi:8-oxo-dGTP pyrophosphatase MutT (NUDIX family)
MPQSTPASRPARPRDAASLLIWRAQAQGLEVLMGRRGSRARFVPDVYVFPGGVLEPRDRRVSARLSAHPFRLSPGLDGNPSLARALACAAVREVHEETGLQLRASVRLSVHGGADAGTDPAALPDLSALRFLGRAITPTNSRMRFHARFFTAPVAAFMGELGGDGELSDLQWVGLDNPARLPMVDVTELMLSELAQQLSGAPHQPALLSYRGDQPRVRRGP